MPVTSYGRRAGNGQVFVSAPAARVRGHDDVDEH